MHNRQKLEYGLVQLCRELSKEICVSCIVGYLHQLQCNVQEILEPFELA